MDFIDSQQSNVLDVAYCGSESLVVFILETSSEFYLLKCLKCIIHDYESCIFVCVPSFEVLPPTGLFVLVAIYL